EEAPKQLLLVCSGTCEQTAYEDVLAAGALCDLVWKVYGAGAADDSAVMARRLFHSEERNLLEAVARSRNGRRLLGHPELRADVEFCAQRDVFPLIAELGRDGLITRRS